MSICQLRGVTKKYALGETWVQALKGVDLHVDAGDFLVLAGPSGSGKTTLLNLVGCLDVPDTGSVHIEGVDVGRLSQRELSRVRAQKIGFIFQQFNLIPVLTALENVELALRLAGREPDLNACRRALDEVGLDKYHDRRPSQLSGGQQQRVAIARALVKRPALVVADEPTANLDSKTGAEVLDLMRDLNQKEGATFVFSTHDRMVIERARRIARILDGEKVREEIPDRAAES